MDDGGQTDYYQIYCTVHRTGTVWATHSQSSGSTSLKKSQSFTCTLKHSPASYDYKKSHILVQAGFFQRREA
jgi:hypothetical protein